MNNQLGCNLMRLKEANLTISYWANQQYYESNIELDTWGCFIGAKC